MPDDILFHEEQRPWAGWAVLSVACCLGIAGFFAWAMVAQIVHHRPVGDRPMSDTTLAVLGPVIIALSVFGVVLALLARLVIAVRTDGLYVQYVPIHRRPRRIALGDVVAVRAVTYRPILRYGGWGIRWAWRAKAYDARGNRGVRLDYASGRHLLLGSQRPDELAAAIEAIWQRERQTG